MKKIFLTMMAAALLVIGLTACGGKHEPYPFKELADFTEEFVEYAKTHQENERIDDDVFDKYVNKRKSWCEKIKGKTMTAEVDPGLGFELVSPYGTFKETEISDFNHKVIVWLTFELRITDVDVASANSMMAVVEDENGLVAPTDRIDWIVNGKEEWKCPKEVKNGDIIEGKARFYIKPLRAIKLKDVSKVVIKKNDDAIRMHY